MDDKTALAFIIILVLINLGLYISRVDTDREIDRALDKMKQEFNKEIEDLRNEIKELKKGNNDENHKV